MRDLILNYQNLKTKLFLRVLNLKLLNTNLNLSDKLRIYIDVIQLINKGTFPVKDQEKATTIRIQKLVHFCICHLKIIYNNSINQDKIIECKNHKQNILITNHQ